MSTNSCSRGLRVSKSLIVPPNRCSEGCFKFRTDPSKKKTLHRHVPKSQPGIINYLRPVIKTRNTSTHIRPKGPSESNVFKTVSAHSLFQLVRNKLLRPQKRRIFSPSETQPGTGSVPLNRIVASSTMGLDPRWFSKRWSIAK
jgi:hypothetical protein